jgi:hypothetical protein
MACLFFFAGLLLRLGIIGGIMNLVRKLVLISSLLLMAIAVNGQEPDPADPEELPVNRDEAAAIARGELTGELARLRVDPPSIRVEDARWTEIDELRTRQRLTLDALANELAAARDHLESLDIQRRMATIKETTEVAILRVQERYAHQAGDDVLAQRLAASIETILNPLAGRVLLSDSVSDKEVR